MKRRHLKYLTKHSTSSSKFLLLLIFLFCNLLISAPSNLNNFYSDGDIILSNAIGDIRYYDGRLFIATVNGLNYSDDFGNSFGKSLEGDGFSALFAGLGKVFLTGSRDTLLQGDSFPLGSGLFYRDIRTESWTHIESPEFTFIAESPNPGNLAYDLEVVEMGMDTVIWIPCFYGGLVKSVDWGENWAQIVPDGFSFDPANRIAHRHFAFKADTFGVSENMIHRVNDIQKYQGPLFVSTEWGLFKSYNNGQEFFPELEDMAFGKMLSVSNMLLVSAYLDSNSGMDEVKHGNGIYVFDRSPEIWTLLDDTLFTYDPILDNFDYSAADLAIEIIDSDTFLWIACSRGGLAKSNALGEDISFERILINGEFNIDNPSSCHNAIFIDTMPSERVFWTGTSDGLYMTHNPESTWIRITTENGLIDNHISQIIQEPDEGDIWVICDGENSGVCFTTNNGESWESVYDDSRIYDIDFANGYVHLATAEGFLYSDANAISWQTTDIVGSYSELRPKTPNVYAVETIEDTIMVGIDRGIAYSLNFYSSVVPAFFVNTTPVDYYWDFPILWDGSGGGIAKSTDGGKNWDLHVASDSLGISGNWVVALDIQRLDTSSVVWAVTKKALGSSEYNALSYSTNGGDTWEVTADGVYGWNFAFCDSIVFCATSGGLIRAKYPELEWDTLEIYDPVSSIEVTNDEIVGLNYADGHLFVGTNQGLAISDDICNLSDDYTFTLISRYPGLPSDGEESYAYPSPFSPYSDGACIIVFPMKSAGSVTVKVYDWVLDEVAIVASGKYFEAGDQRIQWDGKNRNGDIAGNGIYLVSVETPDGTYWSKVMMVK